MNAADVILFASLLGLAATLLILLKAWRVLTEARLRRNRLAAKCAELSAACERAHRSGGLLPADRMHKEI